MSNNVNPMEDARAVLRAMRERAEELDVQGVSIVVSSAVLRELSLINEEELTSLSLVELLINLMDDEQPFMSAVLIDIIGKFEREPDFENRGADDLRTNYFGFAIGKLAQMVRTGENSQGDEPVRRGESAARGGIIRHRIMTAFSGGTEVQDTDISRFGTDKYEELLISRWQEELDRTHPWINGTVLGEKADKEEIIEQNTPFLEPNEIIDEVEITDGTILIVKAKNNLE